MREVGGGVSGGGGWVGRAGMCSDCDPDSSLVAESRHGDRSVSIGVGGRRDVGDVIGGVWSGMRNATLPPR